MKPRLVGVIVAVELIVGCVGGRPASVVNPPIQPAQFSQDVSISAVRAEPKTVVVNKTTQVTVTYALAVPADVVLTVMDEWERVVRTISSKAKRPGTQQIQWDGRTGEGNPVPSGVYYYRLMATTAEGRRCVYAPDQTTGGEELLARRFTYDETSGVFKFVLPHIGRARLRVGLKDYPHLRTLLDWEPLESGQHEVRWNGLDASGLIRLQDHPRLAVNLSAFALPDNALIVAGFVPGSRPPDASAEHIAFRGTRPGPSARPLYLHAVHDRGICHEVRFRVELVEKVGVDAAGIPIVTGRVPIQVTLDTHDRAHVIDQRFEVMFFLDTVSLFEEEQGSDPFTYFWDTTGLTPGRHLITVNVLSYDDHLGVVTQPVIIRGQDAT